MDITKIHQALEIDAKMREIRIGLVDAQHLQIDQIEECEIRISSKTGYIRVYNVKVTDAVKGLVETMKAQLESEYAELQAKLEAL